MTVKGKNSTTLPCVLAFLMFCDLLLEMADMIVPARHMIQLQAITFAGQAPKVILIAIGIIIASAAGFVFFKLIVSGTWEVRIFFAYAVWLVITRIINGDYFIRREFLTVMDIMISFLMFASCSLLNEKQRERLLSALVILYAGFFVIACITGLFITITDTYLCIYPKNDIWIRVVKSAGTNSLVLFSENRLICASWVYIALALGVYAFIKKRTPVSRLLIFVCILILFITIPLFHSRTIQIVMSISFGILAFAIFFMIFKKTPILMRIPILSILTAAAIAIGFFSYNWANASVTALRSYCAPRFESFYLSLSNKADLDIFGIEVSEGISGDMEEQREISTNTTLTGRTNIWKSGLYSIKRDPSIALYGSLNDDLMKPVNKILKEEINPAVKKDKPHMHNMFLQILMLTGIPGLLSVMFWTVLMAKKMIKLFFANPESVPLSVKFLTVPIAGVLIWHIVEAGIFTKTDTFGKVFFMLCGILAGYYYDYFPLKTKGKLFRSK